MPTITVTATDAAGHQTTATVSYTVSSTAPPVPTGFAYEQRSYSSLLITWAASSGATSYNFYRNGVLLGNTPTPDWLDTGLTASTTYQYQASAVGPNGTSALSPNFPATTPAQPPPPPPTGHPDATNTGVPTGTVLTASGAITTSANNQIIDSKDVSGGITVNHSGVIIRKCRVRSTGMYVIRNNSTNLLIEDCTIDGQNVGGNSMGVGNSNVTVRRCNIFGVENGLNVSGNTTVEDSFIHDTVAVGGGHSDGAQFNQGASNITFRHNTIRGGNTSAIIMWDEGNPQNSNVLITDNKLSGGAYTLYTARQGPVTNVRITNNRFIIGTAAFGYCNGAVVGTTVTEWSGNVNDATGALLPPA